MSEQPKLKRDWIGRTVKRTLQTVTRMDMRDVELVEETLATACARWWWRGEMDEQSE